jgi:hypothetical protein
LLVCIGCGSAPPAPNRKPLANARTPEPAPAPADDDPDHDGIRGACDLCPNEPETYNGLLDADGCPDSSRDSHAVIDDPTNRYAYAAAQLTFRGSTATAMAEWEFDDDVEVVAAIGRGTTLDLAGKRASAVGAFLRGYLPKVRPNVAVVELATTAARVYEDADPRRGPESPSDAVVQVIRVRGVDVWRWTGDHLVRATPQRKLQYSPLLPRECVLEGEQYMLPPR